MKTSCIVIVGKPGAGKSSIGSELARLLGGTYISLGGFMREKMHMPDPHIGVDKNLVYDRLAGDLENSEVSSTLVLDCHPYPEMDLEALLSFIKRPSLRLRAVIHVEADDSVALKRLERRPRPGQTNEERLAYFNDHLHIIARLMGRPNTIRVQNNIEFENSEDLVELAEKIVRRL